MELKTKITIYAPSPSASFSFLHPFLFSRFDSKCLCKFDCKLLEAEVGR